MKRVLFSSVSSSSSGRSKPVRKWLEKISARVFCPDQPTWSVEVDDETKSGGGGGNPVTIFAAAPGESLSPQTQQRLAQTCQWESVMVQGGNGGTTSSSPILSFFMPTGQQVSFCAHACMAGAIRVAEELEQETKLKCAKLDENGGSGNDDDDGDPMTLSAAVHEDDIVTLSIRKAPFFNETVSNEMQLYRLLRESCGLQINHLPFRDRIQVPTFVNASVARTKTLVYVKDVETLLKTCRIPSNPLVFERSCRILNTTGLYLYTHHPERDGVFLARQFPAASGYPEDPATGIAAAALAASMHLDLPYCKILQGLLENNNNDVVDYVDPQMRSLILVEDVQIETLQNLPTSDSDLAVIPTAQELEEMEESIPTKFEAMVNYKLVGKIEIDDSQELEIEDEEVDDQQE